MRFSRIGNNQTPSDTCDTHTHTRTLRGRAGAVRATDGPGLGARLEELGAGDALLHDHAGDGDHGEAAVVELLRLHLLERERVRRLQTERVESQVARRVRALDGPPCTLR